MAWYSQTTERNKINNFQSRICYMAKWSFREKSFLDKQKLKGFHHQETNLTNTVKGTSLSWKERALPKNKKTYKSIHLTGKGKYT